MNKSIMDVIEERRSIRNYLEKPISEDLVKLIAKAGRLAPSANDNSAPIYPLPITAKGQGGNDFLSACLDRFGTNARQSIRYAGGGRGGFLRGLRDPGFEPHGSGLERRRQNAMHSSR